MNVFSRFTDIINANLNHLLNKAEHPEKMLALVITEMEEALADVRRSTAKVLFEQRRLENQKQHLLTAIENWQMKAELAIKKDREDLAKQAISEKQQQHIALKQVDVELTDVKRSLTKIQSDSHLLQEKLQEAKSKRNSFVIKENTIKTRLKLREKVVAENIDGVIEKFTRYEQKIARLEAEVDAYDLVNKPSIVDEITQLQQQDELENELISLKQKVVNG